MDSERDRMLRGELYDPEDPELVADRRRASELTSEYGRTAPDEVERRRELLAELFGTVGADCYVEPPLHCDYGSNVHLGDDVYCNADCVILDVCPVEIGSNSQLGPGVHLYAATHPLDAAERAAGRELGKPVTIGEDVWIGGRAVVNPGVTVGDRAVVASGAVVVDDVPPDVVVAGNPAQVVKELDAAE